MIEYVEVNGISYELDKNNLTAKVIGSYIAVEDLYIPRSINFNSQNYIITSIADKLKSACKIKSISFDNDSEIRTIGSTFSYTDIQSISLPASIEKFTENWCSNTQKLCSITISAKNKNFIYLDSKMIIGKSDSKSEDYDILVFARRDIEIAVIPSFIKRISSSAFSDCRNLREIKITEDSQLISIGKNAFSFSKITYFTIPRMMEDLEDDWCSYLSNLTVISISEGNQNFKFLDDKKRIVLGKSNKEDKLYDTIIIASKDIEKVIIPSYIKYIGSSSFSNCKILDKIEFEENSELVSIGESAFFRCSITEIKIPKHVRFMGKHSFLDTQFLEKIEIDKNSELELIEENIFTGSSIDYIYIPKHVKSIGEFSLSSCFNLKEIEFAEDSELVSIESSAFAYSTFEYIKIPFHVKKIDDFAFLKCENLKTVEFDDDCDLTSIGHEVFSHTNIEVLQIPDHVKEIKEGSLMCIDKLRIISFSENSELTSICENAFIESPVETIFFPPKVDFLENNWCNYTFQLANILVSPENKRFTYLDIDHKIVIGKSDLNSETYDVLIFVSREIVKVFVPAFIKKINSCSMSDCTFMRKIEFEENSQLQVIDEGSFSGCNLTSISFPNELKIVEKNSFFLCSELKTVEFLSDEIELKYNSFSDCESLLLISIPNARLVKICGRIITFESGFLSFFVSSKADVVFVKT